MAQKKTPAFAGVNPYQKLNIKKNLTLIVVVANYVLQLF
jgi:hypothetical protein